MAVVAFDSNKLNGAVSERASSSRDSPRAKKRSAPLLRLASPSVGSCS